MSRRSKARHKKKKDRKHVKEEIQKDRQHTEQPWLEDPSELYGDDFWKKLMPHSGMSDIEKTNAIARMSAVVSVGLAAYYRSIAPLALGASGMLLSAVLSADHLKTQAIQQERVHVKHKQQAAKTQRRVKVGANVGRVTRRQQEQHLGSWSGGGGGVQRPQRRPTNPQQQTGVPVANPQQQQPTGVHNPRSQGRPPRMTYQANPQHAPSQQHQLDQGGGPIQKPRGQALAHYGVSGTMTPQRPWKAAPHGRAISLKEQSRGGRVPSDPNLRYISEADEVTVGAQVLRAPFPRPITGGTIPEQHCTRAGRPTLNGVSYPGIPQDYESIFQRPQNGPTTLAPFESSVRLAVPPTCYGAIPGNPLGNPMVHENRVADPRRCEPPDLRSSDQKFLQQVYSAPGEVSANYQFFAFPVKDQVEGREAFQKWVYSDTATHCKDKYSTPDGVNGLQCYFDGVGPLGY